MAKNLLHQLLRFSYPFIRKLLPYQIYTYLAVGALNTLLNITLFISCHHLLLSTSIAVEASTIVALAVTIFTGYWLQKNFVFTDTAHIKKAGRKQLAKYTIVALQGQLSAYLFTKSMILLLHFNASTAYIITTFIMLTLTYFLQKYFTFRREKQFN